MAIIGLRQNTFKVSFENFQTRPSFEDIHCFIHGTLGLSLNQIKRLQMHHVQNCAYVKCSDQKTAEKVVEQHNEKHSIEVGGVKYKVRLCLDDECIEVKIHDLSENVTNDDIAANLKQYGDVHHVKELVWGPTFAYKGVPSGVRVATMTLRRHIKSFISMFGEHTKISYKNQPQSCRHCSQLLHPGKTCTDNKKIIKNDTTSQSKAGNCKTTTLPVMQNSTEQVKESKPTDNEQQQRPKQQKRIVRQLSSSEIESPPRKKTDRRQTDTVAIEQMNEPNAYVIEETRDSEMDSVSSVDLMDSEAEPDPKELEEWIIKFNKKSKKLMKTCSKALNK